MIAACWLAALLAFQTAGVIRGVVVDTAGGAPVAGVPVRLTASGRATATDALGRFEFLDVLPGPQQLEVSAGVILVQRSVVVAPGAAIDVTIALAEGTGRYLETLSVTGDAPPDRREPAVAAEQTLERRQLEQLRGILINDPLRAVQALPGVAASDDFRSEFAIRGAGVQQMNFTFEGIATSFLLHTVQQVHDGGSIAMVNGDVLDEVTLLTGAYPQRFGNRTGSEIDFRMREGSRDGVRSRTSVSAVDASSTIEGPVGRNRQGAWLFAARKSYLDLVVRRLYDDQNLTFGFGDAQAKVTYDLTSNQQLQAAFTGGRSRLQRDPDLIGAGSLRDADNQSALMVVTWRYSASPTLTLSQRVGVVENGFANVSRDGVDLDSGDSHEFIYRAGVSAAPHRALAVEAGGEARWSAAIGREQRLVAGRFQVREAFDNRAVTASAYIHTRLGPRAGAADPAGPATTWAITPGVRVDRFSLLDRTTASPWVQAVVPLFSVLTLRAGAGIQRQEPDFAQLLGSRGTPALRSARAYAADAGIDGPLAASARWQVTVYNREDRDVLRLPLDEMRIVNSTLLNASTTSHFTNALDGYARGVEWQVQRQSARGFSGWASYSLGFTRYHDRTTGERFWGDYDQRHTVNVFAAYRLSDRLTFSGRFRAGSNVPTTGYWTERDGAYFVGTDRNTVRVPEYARLDVRANRNFTFDRAQLTLFVEAINVLNRSNVRYALPSVNRRTFQATGLYERLIPLIPAVGVLLEF